MNNSMAFSDRTGNKNICFIVIGYEFDSQMPKRVRKARCCKVK